MMDDALLTNAFVALMVAIPVILYTLSQRRRARLAREAAEKGKVYSDGPKAQHPRIDTTFCIGCQSCTTVCPEGDVLAMLGGKAVIVNAYKCIGHGLCADACPVGAIQLVMASPSMGANLPYLTPEYETSVPNLFIAGELGGLALIKNAVHQGRSIVDTVVERLGSGRGITGVHDVLIVGAGPAGISASLQAIKHGLDYLTLERDEVGGTVAKYPRQKLVMTSPIEFPMYGKFKKTELSKENLLAFWHQVMARADFKVHAGEKVEDIQRGADGIFSITTDQGQYRSQAVVLALGRTGTPRKLGIPGESLPKVMYRLIEADHYFNKKILIVGGGDSAVEAAMGLARQKGNQVTLSYRKSEFSRLKERNVNRIEESIRSGKLTALFNSNPIEIKDSSVVMEVNGQREDLQNDYVWVFAGGEPPNDFLKKVGISFGTHDVTAEAGKEARLALSGDPVRA
ncbi:MAG: NAD(P)-binding domain-containing protein [Bryobacteraceae bacterium]